MVLALGAAKPLSGLGPELVSSLPTRLPPPHLSWPLPGREQIPKRTTPCRLGISYVNSHSGKAELLSCLSFKTKTRVFSRPCDTPRCRFMEPATGTATPLASRNGFFR